MFNPELILKFNILICLIKQLWIVIVDYPELLTSLTCDGVGCIFFQQQEKLSESESIQQGEAILLKFSVGACPWNPSSAIANR